MNKLNQQRTESAKLFTGPLDFLLIMRLFQTAYNIAHEEATDRHILIMKLLQTAYNIAISLPSIQKAAWNRVVTWVF